MFINRSDIPDIQNDLFDCEEDDVNHNDCLEFSMITLKPESIVIVAATPKGVVIAVEKSSKSGFIDSNE